MKLRAFAACRFLHFTGDRIRAQFSADRRSPTFRSNLFCLRSYCSASHSFIAIRFRLRRRCAGDCATQDFLSPFASGAGWLGFGAHLLHEWVILTNLLLLLLGFAVARKHFEDSHVPNALPRFLPDDWKGCFALLAIVFVLSSFLDNIAAALIGGAMAHTVFRAKVHIGYLAAIVAASNAGGAGSVIGDTTTTMMWIAGISPLEVAEAAIAATVALVSSVSRLRFSKRYAPIQRHSDASVSTDCG